MLTFGFVGAGNMASALAAGMKAPFVCYSPSGKSADELAKLHGGSSVANLAQLVADADVVVLAHKPVQLDLVAAKLGAHGKPVVSLLGGVSQQQLVAAYPGSEIVRTMPNTPVEVGKGLIAVAESQDLAGSELRQEILAQLGRAGKIVELPEAQMAAATAAAGVLPAYIAVFAEALADSVVRQGMPAETARQIVSIAIEGCGALLAAHGGDFLEVRKQVTSPGGSTARGLRELDRLGFREAIQAATDAVVGVS